MTYEEKKKEMETKGCISTQLLLPIDYFKFIRDGIMKKVRLHVKGGDNLYEVHCTLLESCPWENIYIADNCISMLELHGFMTKIIESNLIGYFELEQDYYKLELDVLETYD